MSDRLSEYEEARLRTMASNEAFLASLELAPLSTSQRRRQGFPPAPGSGSRARLASVTITAHWSRAVSCVLHLLPLSQRAAPASLGKQVCRGEQTSIYSSSYSVRPPPLAR